MHFEGCSHHLLAVMALHSLVGHAVRDDHDGLVAVGAELGVGFGHVVELLSVPKEILVSVAIVLCIATASVRLSRRLGWDQGVHE